MAKWSHADVKDGLLNVVRNNATRIAVFSIQPTVYEDYTAALSVKTIAGPTDISAAEGTTTRTITVKQQADCSVAASGDASNVALLDSTNSKLLYITTCTPQTLTAGNTVTIPAWNITVNEAT